MVSTTITMQCGGVKNITTVEEIHYYFICVPMRMCPDADDVGRVVRELLGAEDAEDLLDWRAVRSPVH